MNSRVRIIVAVALVAVGVIAYQLLSGSNSQSLTRSGFYEARLVHETLDQDQVAALVVGEGGGDGTLDSTIAVSG